jgi:hypothetical protein
MASREQPTKRIRSHGGFDLTEKLLAERAGILNWAMQGLRRLRARGRLIQPASGMELIQKLRARRRPSTANHRRRGDRVTLPSAHGMLLHLLTAGFGTFAT